MLGTVCPTCGEESGFEGTARAAVRHYFSRTIRDLHELRVAAIADAQQELSKYASGLIFSLESLADRLFEDRRH